MPALPFKLNQDRRHHIPKQKRKVTNSAAYDAALRQRGSLTVWFTEEAVVAWKAGPRTTAGGQPWYSPLAILTALTLRAVFHLALRQTEGLIGSIIGLDLAVPDRSTLCRRAATLKVPPPRPRRDGEPVHLLVDSTGLKLCGAGEWLIEEHGAKTRRSWWTLHIGMGADTGQIVAATLTRKEVDDGSQVGPLLDQVAASVASFTADGAYDQYSVYAAVATRHPAAAIIVPPRSTAVPSETAETAPTKRDRHLQFIAKHGRAAWQKASGYTIRARAEATVGRFKQVIGDDSYEGSGRLTGKAAIITGGDSGIGRAVAIAFAREGADVLISYLDEADDARESARWVEEAGWKAVLVVGDIADPAHCREIVRRTVDAFGRVDVLVNNAAFQMTRESLDEISDEEWDRTFDVNIGAMFRLTKAAVPHMGPGGAIVNTASVNADTPKPKLLSYSATKAAIQNFTGSLAQLLAEKGIRANCVAPGPIWTPLIPATTPVEQVKSFGSEVPMQRPGQPAELAPVYVMLASDEASYVSGATIAVTGGKSII